MRENIVETYRKKFEKGEQKRFLLAAKQKLGMAWPQLAEKLAINPQTLRTSYLHEYCALPFGLYEKICRLGGWEVDYSTRIVIADASHINNFGKRKLALQGAEWTAKEPIALDYKEDAHETKSAQMRIRYPQFMNEDLAEETGIHIGDGFMADKRCDFRVKGDRKNERAYYDGFMFNLYKRLYNIEINNKDWGTCYGFEISSKRLWRFKTKALGIHGGRKTAIAVPKLIMDSDYYVMAAFLRGLLDTDGSFYFLPRGGREGYYPVISLTCRSEFLARDVLQCFTKLGFSPRHYHLKDGMNVIYLYGYSNFEHYEKRIGWHNPKNLEKISDYRKRWPRL